jgi:hypothetical protein
MDRSFKLTLAQKADQSIELLEKVISKINPDNVMAKVYLQEVEYIKNNNKETS